MTTEDAESVLERLKFKPGFRDAPHRFRIQGFLVHDLENLTAEHLNGVGLHGVFFEKKLPCGCDPFEFIEAFADEGEAERAAEVWRGVLDEGRVVVVVAPIGGGYVAWEDGFKLA